MDPRNDIVSRFMTAQGVLVKTDLWDTGKFSHGMGIVRNLTHLSKSGRRKIPSADHYVCICSILLTIIYSKKSSHYRRANGDLLVYSITDRASFASCTTWL